MGKTIIQTIGPLYGEVVNGTVFGRPNGSIYVPPVNTVSLTISAEYIANGTGAQSTVLYPTNAGGSPVYNATKIVAQAQDVSAYIGLQVSDDSEFSTYSENNQPAGLFNITRTSLIVSDIVVVDETNYYVRAVLYSANGVPVAYSDVVTLVGVA